MNFRMVKGDFKNLDDCVEALTNSELGMQYFSEKDKAKNALVEGFEKEEILVAIDDSGSCIGFIWYILEGAFHAYPYLHIIAIKEECRGNGIGTKIMEYVENILSENYSKCFFVVGDFNSKARRLYEKIGYRIVGQIPDLYKKGVTENLMMKLLK